MATAECRWPGLEVPQGLKDVQDVDLGPSSACSTPLAAVVAVAAAAVATAVLVNQFGIASAVELLPSRTADQFCKQGW